MADTDPQPEPTGNLEPVLTAFLVSTITAVGAAVGFDMSTETIGKIATAAVGLIVVAVSAWAARSKVTPVAKLDAAAQATPADGAVNVTHADLVAAQPATEPPAGPPVADVTSTFDDAEVDAIAAPAPTPNLDALRALAKEAGLPPMPRQRAGLVDPATTDDILAAKFGPVG